VLEEPPKSCHRHPPSTTRVSPPPTHALALTFASNHPRPRADSAARGGCGVVGRRLLSLSRRRPFKPFSHHAPAQIKAALQSKATMPRAAAPVVPTATLHEQHPDKPAVRHMHPGLAKRLLPPAPEAALPFKVRDAHRPSSLSAPHRRVPKRFCLGFWPHATLHDGCARTHTAACIRFADIARMRLSRLQTPSLPPPRPGVPPHSPPPPLAQRPPVSSPPMTNPTFGATSPKRTAVAFPVRAPCLPTPTNTLPSRSRLLRGSHPHLGASPLLVTLVLIRLSTASANPQPPPPPQTRLAHTHTHTLL